MDGGHPLKTQIQSFIVRKFPAARKRGIDEQTPLLEAGIVDSLGVLELVGFLEQSFRIKVADEELTPENFGNIHHLASFVENKREQVAASSA
ncbi:MAG TPA: acyl carrier protein [Verrucomicrobiae bacterium]|nr:acyl carrier protein [Verrucomicrobiae bacterium]